MFGGAAVDVPASRIQIRRKQKPVFAVYFDVNDIRKYGFKKVQLPLEPRPH
jgi:hypothetical protein